MQKTIFVTSADGFIGSHLVDHINTTAAMSAPRSACAIEQRTCFDVWAAQGMRRDMHTGHDEFVFQYAVCRNFAEYRARRAVLDTAAYGPGASFLLTSRRLAGKYGFDPLQIE